MLRADPSQLVLEYTRLMMGFLLLQPAPERIAMIGLGGGSLAKYCAATLPEVDFTAVEMSSEVIDLRDAFGIPPDGPRFRILCEDGAEFVRRDGPPFDVLIVDAFDRTGQPESLCSAAFYDACHDRLGSGGVLAVNLYTDDPSYELRVRRIHDAFGGKVVVVEVAEAENDLVRRHRLLVHAFAELVSSSAGAHAIGLGRAAEDRAILGPVTRAQASGGTPRDPGRHSPPVGRTTRRCAALAPGSTRSCRSRRLARSVGRSASSLRAVSAWESACV
jgi:hypothetical protein